jgi:DTW domain-containing protein YfiP
MSRTGTFENRCQACRMSKHLCICSLIPRIELQTRVVVLMHWRESRLTTNTANLAHLALPNSEIRLRGEKKFAHDRASEPPLPEFDPATTALLFPSEDSIELNEQTVGQFPKGLTLVVPDGSWRQAQRVPVREPAVKNIPRLRLPPGPPSNFRLRHSPHESHLSTFEAIARALGVLEGKEVQKQLEDIFLVMVERVLWARGKLAAKDAVTGIPIEAFEPARLAGIAGGKKKGWKALPK